MRIPIILSAVLAAVLSPPLSSAPQKGAANTAPPPILDRELFFGNPDIADAQLSPDGARIAFLKPWKGTRNIWVKKTGEPYSAARLMTADLSRPIPSFMWSRDSKWILFTQDHGGDENYNLYAVDPSSAPTAGGEAPMARNLTDVKGVRAVLYALPETEPDVAMVGLNDRDSAWHDLYKVKISTGERTLLRKNADRIVTWLFDLEGGLRLAFRATPSGSNEILRVDAEGYTPVYTSGIFETAIPLRFHKDGRRVYLQTNKGARDLVQLALLDPATGKEEVVDADPAHRVDLVGATFSEATGKLLFTIYQDDRERIYFHDKMVEADYKRIRAKLPGKSITISGSTADERLWMVAAFSDIDPGSRYLFDRRTKKLQFQYATRENLPREHMAPVTPIRYKSSDGLEIPAYLTLPKGIPAKALPLVVFPHGGPWLRDSWGFNNRAQFLANRGYAVLSPNFRGSSGFGKKFLDAGNKQWGEKMQDDLTWGVKHLVSKGIVDPKRVGIMGLSYGGYATLAGAAFTPDLYAAGISIVGPSNLLTLLETIPPYWEVLRTTFHERMGNPGTPEGKKQLENQSPLFSASRIKTPLLVAQGANDPRVKKTESEQIVIALRDRNFPVEYLCAPDEGHGFARPLNNLALMTAVERFLAKHLKGRVQDGATAEVTAKLAEITVDPRSVVLTKKADAASAGVPKAIAGLTPGKSVFQGHLEVGGQTFPVSVTRDITEEGGSIIIKDTTKLPTGDAVDAMTLEKGSLIPRKRVLKQGPIQLELAFEGGKATGSMAIGTNARPISVELGGDLFGDGAGSDETLGSLPLAEGFTAVFRTFDLQKQKVALKRVNVVGQEEITVPAGTFKTWKLELTSAEGDPGQTTLWIAQSSRLPIKIRTVLPQAAGAVLTVERQP